MHALPLISTCRPTPVKYYGLNLTDSCRFWKLIYCVSYSKNLSMFTLYYENYYNYYKMHKYGFM